MAANIHPSTRRNNWDEYIQLVAAAMAALIQADAMEGVALNPTGIVRSACDHADAALDEILNRTSDDQ